MPEDLEDGLIEPELDCIIMYCRQGSKEGRIQNHSYIYMCSIQYAKFN